MEIIRLYIEEEMGMTQIGLKLDRSSKSIYDHIKKHNYSVEKLGYCPLCRRAKGKYEQTIARREKQTKII